MVGWRRLGHAAATQEHLQERSGEFTLIVLGEVVVRTVGRLHVVHWDTRAWIAVLGVAIIVLCVGWLTFDFMENAVPRGRRWRSTTSTKARWWSRAGGSCVG